MNMTIDKKLFEAKINKKKDLITLEIKLKQRTYAADPVIYWNSKNSLEYLQEYSDETRIGDCVGQTSSILSSTANDNLPFFGSWTFVKSQKLDKKSPERPQRKPRGRSATPQKKNIRKRMSKIAEDSETVRKKE